MAKDHVYQDVLVRAHAAALAVSHLSPVRQSQYLVNAYMEMLPQYLADNPDQLPDAIDPQRYNPAGRNDPLPPMSAEGKLKRELAAKYAKEQEVKQAAREAAAKALKDGPPKAIKTEHGVLYKDPTPNHDRDRRR